MDCCNLGYMFIKQLWNTQLLNIKRPSPYGRPNKSSTVEERNVTFYGLSKKMCPPKALIFKGNGR